MEWDGIHSSGSAETVSTDVAEVQAVLRHLVSVLPESQRDALRVQIDHILSVSGLVTMLDVVSDGEQCSECEDGILPLRAIVKEGSREYIGELLVWTEAGRIATLEYAWITDDPPSALPSIENVSVSKAPPIWRDEVE
jgi:hypothetical protein